MIKILLEGNEAAEYVDAKAELDRLRALNSKLTSEASRSASLNNLTINKPALVKLPDLNDLMSALSTKNYINSVKAIRAISGATLMDAKTFFETFFDRTDKSPLEFIDNEAKDGIDEDSKPDFIESDLVAPEKDKCKCKHDSFYLPEDNVYICLDCDQEFDPVKDPELVV